MKRVPICIIFFVVSLRCFGQVLPIDTLAINNWPIIRDVMVSKDGNYCAYSISKSNDFSPHTTVLVIEKIKTNDALKRISGIRDFSFTSINDVIVFNNYRDSLRILNLKTGASDVIANVIDYKLLKGKSLIACEIKSGSTTAINLVNIAKGTKNTFENVNNWGVSVDGQFLYFQKTNDKKTFEFFLFNTKTRNLSKIWKGGQVLDLIFSKNNQIAFIGQGQDTRKQIWYYDYKKMGTARPIPLNLHSTMPDSLSLEELLNFNSDEDKIFCNLKIAPTKVEAKKNIADVDVWSYLDVDLQSQRLNSQIAPPSISCLATIEIDNGKILQLQRPGENASVFDNDKAVLLSKNDVYGNKVGNEQYWNRAKLVSESIISTKDGMLLKKLDSADNIFSNGKNFYIFFSATSRSVFSFDANTGKTINLTNDIQIPKTDSDYDKAPGPVHGEFIFYRNNGMELPENDYCFIYDKFDIWKLDPSGKNRSINLTNGYGRKHNITFAMLTNAGKPVIIRGKMILYATDNNTKEEGFYSEDINHSSDPMMLTMGNYKYNFETSDNPVEKNNAKLYLISKESASSFLNYYLTSDFKYFFPLTDIHPESPYNWPSTMLIHWIGLDNVRLTGIMYKPKNFDPKKKYPIIITYYEKMYHELNEFIKPELSYDRINIPWFVSRNYIVVLPDINYKIGHPGASAVNSVVSLANYLKTLDFIDSTKIGIQGHSFGGFETNYIITHSNIFAAAMAGSGFSDLVSLYNSVAPGNLRGDGSNDGGASLQYFADVDQIRIGATLWQRPDLFIENSPVFRADKVTTPLLMMNNKFDGIVPFSQGIEFFTALRRLGKQVWMLQYNGESHSILKWQNQYDYTIRMDQFFAHYLKDAPAPFWMTKGIPESEKGTTDGLEYDPVLKEPPPSPLIESGEDPKIIYNYP